MRRRHTLRPDTFPFLAVLLCAMGSLILVLMVFDRQARRAARERARQAREAAERQSDELTARLLAQQEQARRDRLARHRADQERLAAQERRLRAEYERVRDELGAALRALDEGRRRHDDAKVVTASEVARAGQARQQLAERKQQLSQVSEEVEATRKQRERLAADLLRLEELLARLRQQRQRDQRTWSVVPYAGRRGRDSRPLYVECTAGGLVFHPERTSLSAPLTLAEVRDEIERRTKESRANIPAGAGRAYWMLLVRPDGIMPYYLALTALRALEVDYGYEFVDADWVLDFPDPEKAPKPLPADETLARPGPGGGGVVAAGAARTGGGATPAQAEPGSFLPREAVSVRPPGPGQSGQSAPPERPGADAGPGTGRPGSVPPEQSDPAIGVQPEGAEGEGGPAGGSKGKYARGSTSPPRRPAPLQAEGEWVLVVECDGQGVRLSPSRLSIPLEDLRRDQQGGALLLQTVQGLLQQRRAAVRPNDPPLRPVVRFLVRPDGLRAFHLAYPALNAVDAAKRTVMSDE